MLMACRIPQVYFGVKGGALTQTAVATSDTYTAAEMCGIIANSSGYIYPGALPTWDCLCCQLATCPSTVVSAGVLWVLAVTAEPRFLRL